MVYGYVRVSSKEQNEDRQIIALNGLGIPEEQIYIDKQSGKDFNRHKYLIRIDKLQAGDTLYILSIVILHHISEKYFNFHKILI